MESTQQTTSTQVIQSFGLRKTRRGWIGQRIKETYARQDITCGIPFCREHASHPLFSMDRTEPATIYFVDEHSLFHQLDVIQNCERLTHLVVVHSLVDDLRAVKPAAYNHFRHFVEGQLASRKIYVFPNQYHLPSLTPPVPSTCSRQQKQARLVVQCANWFQNHISDQGLSSIVKVGVLTSSYESQKAARQFSVPAVTLIDYLKANDSNLLDFLGFADESSLGAKLFETKQFEEHPTKQQLISAIKKGQMVQAKFMDSKSYLKIAGATYPCILQNNRAFYGDLVAVQVLPENKWRRNLFVLDEEDDTAAPESFIPVENTNSGLLQNLKTSNLLPVAKVVGVLKRISRDFCGSLSENALEVLPTKQEIRAFYPVDLRFPTFYVKTQEASQLVGKRIVVSFDRWPANSLQPLGKFKRVIGPANDPRTEGDVILLQHNVQTAPFSKAVYACLPPAGAAFTITPEQIAKRSDMRHIDVCSIDPPGCKDIDDALHCVSLPDGTFEVGVHIADVSYFVRPDTPIDLEAANRSTTVYLVDRRTDMLPKLLTEDLCSLRSNVERLVFSSIWIMDKDANILKTRFCKGVIRSRRAFTYAEAQAMIDDTKDKSSLAQSVRNLNMLAKALKNKRIQDGALQLASTQVKFSFADQTSNPTDVQLYNLLDTNSLVEEFMLLANVSVAEKIVQHYPAVSILRHHAPPKERQLLEFSKLLSTQGYDLRYSTSKELADSLDALERAGDPFFNKLMRIFATRCMNEATYFCSSDFDLAEFRHYGLAAPLYTHFTSPIRRYADVLVHRLLAASIDVQALPNTMSNKQKLTKICDKMNSRHRMARFASRASSDYHTFLFFKDRKTQERAIITAIGQENFSVMLPKYGLESQIIYTPEDREKNLQLNSQQTIATKCYYQNKQRSIFDYINVKISVELKGFHKKIILEQI